MDRRPGETVGGVFIYSGEASRKLSVQTSPGSTPPASGPAVSVQAGGKGGWACFLFSRLICFHCYAIPAIDTARQFPFRYGWGQEALWEKGCTALFKRRVPSDDARFCGTRGARIEARRFCTACGGKLEPGDNFCTQCGSPAEDVSVPKTSAGPARPRETSPPCFEAEDCKDICCIKKYTGPKEGTVVIPSHIFGNNSPAGQRPGASPGLQFYAPPSSAPPDPGSSCTGCPSQ